MIHLLQNYIYMHKHESQILSRMEKLKAVIFEFYNCEKYLNIVIVFVQII
jgi:hypothetical protein